MVFPGPALLRFLFPALCCGCGKDVEPFGGNAVCRECRSKIQLSRFAGKSVGSLQALSCAFRYEGPLRKIVHAFKYKGKDYLGGALLDFWTLRTKVTLAEKKFDALIPVPMALFKEWKRGYNPARVLAEELSRRHRIPLISGILARRLFSPSQTLLSGRERWKNAAQSFGLTRRCVPKKISNVLIVDDVVTTGATLHACAGLLRKAGVKNVSGFALARED